MTTRAQVAVVGGGLIGVGVAQRFAFAGHPVTVFNRSPASSRRAQASFDRRLAHLRELGFVPRGTPAAVHWSHRLEETVAGAAVVIETAAEDLEAKQDLFARLDRLCRPPVILATSTSGLPIAQIAMRVEHPERVLGTHFLNPPTLLPGVEVIPSAASSPDVTARVLTLLRGVGMRPTVVPDVAGFIASRLSVALRREAWALVAEGVADPETIDAVWRDGLGRAYAASGPLEISDTSGLDVLQKVHALLEPLLHGPSVPHPHVADLVARGQLGAKTGAGFYRWTASERAAVERRRDRVLAAIASAADGDAPR